MKAEKFVINTEPLDLYSDLDTLMFNPKSARSLLTRTATYFDPGFLQEISKQHQNESDFLSKNKTSPSGISSVPSAPSNPPNEKTHFLNLGLQKIQENPQKAVQESSQNPFLIDSLLSGLSCQKLEFLRKTKKFYLNKIEEKSFASLSQLLTSLPGSSLKLVSDFYCKICSVLCIKAELSCGDSICISCFFSKLDVFLRDPVITHFKAVSCPTCQINISIKDIEKYFPELLKEFLSIDLKIFCEVCNMPSSALKNYWSECPCTHICANCVTSSIYCNRKKCNFCGLGFKSFISLRRISECEDCGLIKNSIKYYFSYFGKIRCFKCLETAVQNKQVGSYMKAIGFFLNKRCYKCLSDFAVPDIVIKECCNRILCESCCDESGCCP